MDVGGRTHQRCAGFGMGRGGPNLVRSMGALRDTCDALGLSYRLFGFDSDMSEVI